MKLNPQTPAQLKLNVFVLTCRLLSSFSFSYLLSVLSVCLFLFFYFVYAAKPLTELRVYSAWSLHRNTKLVSSRLLMSNFPQARTMGLYFHR